MLSSTLASDFAEIFYFKVDEIKALNCHFLYVVGHIQKRVEIRSVVNYSSSYAKS